MDFISAMAEAMTIEFVLKHDETPIMMVDQSWSDPMCNVIADVRAAIMKMAVNIEGHYDAAQLLLGPQAFKDALFYLGAVDYYPTAPEVPDEARGSNDDLVRALVSIINKQKDIIDTHTEPRKPYIDNVEIVNGGRLIPKGVGILIGNAPEIIKHVQGHLVLWQPAALVVMEGL